MHRFFVMPAAVQGGTLTLKGEQARQVANVLRLRPGQTIVALDNSGCEYTVELTEVGRERIRGRVVRTDRVSREAQTELTLFQSLLKTDKFDWVLQKGAEIGIAAFFPVISERVVAGEVSRTRRARWERILREAAEQSGRTRLPHLGPVIPISEAVARAEATGGCALIPWEEENAADLRAELSPAGPVSLLIGPEGGYSAAEIELARAHGIKPVTLGPRVLRAETAALVAATAILFSRGDLH